MITPTQLRHAQNTTTNNRDNSLSFLSLPVDDPLNGCTSGRAWVRNRVWRDADQDQ